MFCSNCGTKLPEGANFCSACGAKVIVADPGKQDIKPVTDNTLTGIPQREADKKSISTPKKSKVTFDWSNVIDEPQKKEIPEIKSPWVQTGGIDEKELYAEMTPSTDRSRTMSFIDILRMEKEAGEAEEASFKKPVETPVEAVKKVEEKHIEEPAKEEKTYSFYVPELYDEDEEVKTPFETIPSEEPVYEDYKTEEIETDDIEEDYPEEPSDDFDFTILEQYQADEEELSESVESEPAKIEPVEVEEKTKAESVISDLEEQLASILSDGKGLVGKEPEIKEPEADPEKIEQERYESLEDAYLDMDADLTEKLPHKDKLPEKDTIDEEDLFREMEEETPKKTGMTIAAPADKESEIEALKKRLAELMGTAEEPEEIEKEDKLEVEDLIPGRKTAPVEDDGLEEFFVQTVDYDKEPAPVLEREETAIPVMAGEQEDEESTDIESDAFSIEELEKEIFGEDPDAEGESEATKKIDKFYTLYRKNEEFQRLLDEEYNKLKADEEFIVPAVTEEPEIDLAQEVRQAIEEQIAVPVTSEDEQLEKKKEKIATSVEAPVAQAVGTPVTQAPEAVSAAILPEEISEVEEEEEEGSGALTIIAVILAVILVILLAVLLILQLAPDSAAALKIDSLIENITSHFSAVDVIKNEFLL